MKRKSICLAIILLWGGLSLSAQTTEPIDPYGVTAISVSGKKAYVSKPEAKVLEYPIEYTIKNALWDGSRLTAHRNGLYVVTVSFVKDSYYFNGTQDDVYVTVFKEDTSGIQTNMGFAWSGEGTGRRGTGTYTVVIELAEGEKIFTRAHCATGKLWHLNLYNLTIYSLPTYLY